MEISILTIATGKYIEFIPTPFIYFVQQSQGLESVKLLSYLDTFTTTSVYFLLHKRVKGLIFLKQSISA